MKYQPATVKAGLVTGLFALFGVVSLFFFTPHLVALFWYGLILIHTFFSIRCFSALIDGRDLGQWAVDIVLVISYAGLAVAMPDLRLYFGVMIWVFAVATLKYVLLIGRLPQPILLQRKITADILGALLGGVGYVVAVTGVPYGVTTLAIMFMIGTFYYLVMAPLYVPDEFLKR